MHGILQRLDDALIDRVFQPWVDWTSEHLPVDCFGQARVCTSLAAAIWILSQAGGVAAATRSGLVAAQVVQATLLLLGLAAIMVLHTLFQRAGGGTGLDRGNPLRVTMYVHRMIMLFGLVVGIAKVTMGRGTLALLAVAFFTWAATYVGACSNPPPKQHVRQRRKSASADRYNAVTQA